MNYSIIDDIKENQPLENPIDRKTSNQLFEENENKFKGCFKKIYRKKIQILIGILVILVITLIVFIILFVLKYNEIKKKDEELKKKDEEIKREKYNKEELIEEDTNKSNGDTNEKEYTINESSKYRICLYGPKAEKGGRGCVKCAERYFESGSIIKYQLGGKTSGGEGGTDCGIYKGRGYNGAGLSMAYFSDDFYIIAGGGGGNSESGNRGGDCEQDGEGQLGGNGAYLNRREGGNGGYSSDQGEYCGGGGGNGYKGGQGGGYGNLNNDGGGGGGSSYCNKTKEVICLQTSINIFEYSKLEIYKKVFEE
jgi:hypothetical protein